MIYVHVRAIHENSFTNTCTVGISLQSSEWIKWHRDFLPKFLNTFVLSTFIVPIKVVRVVQMRHTCTMITMYMYVYTLHYIHVHDALLIRFTCMSAYCTVDTGLAYHRSPYSAVFFYRTETLLCLKHALS